jgi:hypothetical protein
VKVGMVINLKIEKQPTKVWKYRYQQGPKPIDGYLSYRESGQTKLARAPTI